MLLGKVKTLFLDAKKGWIEKEIETSFESLPERERKESEKRENKDEEKVREMKCCSLTSYDQLLHLFSPAFSFQVCLILESRFHRFPPFLSSD